MADLLNFPEGTDKSIVYAYAMKRQEELAEQFNRHQAKIDLINEELHNMWNEFAKNWMMKDD